MNKFTLINTNSKMYVRERWETSLESPWTHNISKAIIFNSEEEAMLYKEENESIYKIDLDIDLNYG